MQAERNQQRWYFVFIFAVGKVVVCSLQVETAFLVFD
jgi:hypothetical protein